MDDLIEIVLKKIDFEIHVLKVDEVNKNNVEFFLKRLQISWSDSIYIRNGFRKWNTIFGRHDERCEMNLWKPIGIQKPSSSGRVLNYRSQYPMT